MVDFLDRVAGVPETVFCRYNPGGTFSLGESEEGFQVMDRPGEAKYGMTEEQMADSFRRLKAKGARTFGIHAFLASNTISDEYYPQLAAILFRLAVRLSKAADVHIKYINLSGGVGIPYRPGQPENNIYAIGERGAPPVRGDPGAGGHGGCGHLHRDGPVHDRALRRPWCPPPSTKSTSTRSTSVWTPARPT